MDSLDAHSTPSIPDPENATLNWDRSRWAVRGIAENCFSHAAGASQEAVQGDGCIPSPSGIVLLRRACLGVGQEAVHGRKEEQTGHRRKGTVWMQGHDLESLAGGVRLWAVR
jgi:hypothetical protein